MAKKLVALLLFGLIISIPGTAAAQQRSSIEVLSQDWHVPNDGTWNLTFATDAPEEVVSANITVFAIEGGSRIPIHRFDEIPVEVESNQTDWQLDIRSLSSSETDSTLIPGPGTYIIGIELTNSETTIAATETVLNVTTNDATPDPTLALITDSEGLAMTFDLLERTNGGALVALDIAAIELLLENADLRSRAVSALENSTAFSYASTNANISKVNASELLDELIVLVENGNEQLSEIGIAVLPSFTLIEQEPDLQTYQAFSASGINQFVLTDSSVSEAYRPNDVLDTQVHPIVSAEPIIQGPSSAVSEAAVKLATLAPVVPLDLRSQVDLGAAEALLEDFAGTSLANNEILSTRDLPTSNQITSYSNSTELAMAFQLARSFASQGNDTIAIGLGYQRQIIELLDEDIAEPELASLTAEITTDLAQVEILSGQQINVASTEAELPVTIVNNSDTTRQLTLNADSEKATIAESSRQITVEPGTNLENIRVEFRSLGSTDLDISLTTLDSRVTVSSESLPVRSTAFPGMGVGLSALALASLLAWWGWTVRRNRDSSSIAEPRIVSLEDQEPPYNGIDLGGGKIDGRDIDNRTGTRPSHPL